MSDDQQQEQLDYIQDAGMIEFYMIFFLTFCLEQCKRFLEQFPVHSEEKKYMNCLQAIARQEEKILAVELDDIQKVTYLFLLLLSLILCFSYSSIMTVHLKRKRQILLLE